MISVNQPIIDFELEVFQDNQIRKIKLSDYKGKWLVLAFYPADFTFICPTELKELASLYPEFKKENAEIVSVSTDTAYAHKAWHESSPLIKEITYPMASDKSGKLSKELGTYIEEEGLSVRATFIIDPDGVVKAMEFHDNSIGRSAAEILRKLQAAAFVRKNKSEVCPASWKPGQKTVKPDISLVGKI